MFGTASDSNVEGLRKTARKNAGTIALVTGGVAVTLLGYRFVRARIREARERERELNEWLSTRFDILQEALGLDSEKLAWLRNEVDTMAKSLYKMHRASKYVRPSMQDLIDIGAEKQLLKLRMKIHKQLHLTAESEMRALHQFYDDFRRRLLEDAPPVQPQTVTEYAAP